jgi:lipoate-protein ligase A
MAIYKSLSFNPYFNLALEEVIFRYMLSKEDILMLWVSDSAFIVGRNQNPFIEINRDYLNKDIPIIRRISGGGTIYQDRFTINFSYMTSDYQEKINNYHYFLEPIIKLLNELELNVIFMPKSHLFLEGKKISGNAQAFIGNKLLHHGTLLFDSNIELIEDALVKHTQTAVGNQVLSNKQFCVNIKQKLRKKITIEEMINLVMRAFIKERAINDNELVISDDILQRTKELVRDKYLSWDWNFGRTPRFEVDFKSKKENIKIVIDKGIVTGISNNDFLGLIGCVYLSEEYLSYLKSKQ